MRSKSFVLILSVMLAAAAGSSCTAEIQETMIGGGGGAGPGGGGAGTGPDQTGLPCDVADTLKAYCLACHGNPPSGGAPIPLVTYEHLAAQSSEGGTVASRCVARMKDAAFPMPPSPGGPTVPAAEVAAFEQWVQDGMAMGTCGAGGAGGSGPNPYDTPETCTSGVTWMGGEEDWNGYDKDSMHPGAKCIDCHLNPGKYGLQDTGPDMWIGGTVYPTAHEYDECIGVDGAQQPVDVEITDANGQVVTLQANASGNFYLRKQLGTPEIVFPIKAKVLSGGESRAMSQTVATGDCNSCHTLKGTENAPGRIMAP